MAQPNWRSRTKSFIFTAISRKPTITAGHHSEQHRRASESVVQTDASESIDQQEVDQSNSSANKQRLKKLILSPKTFRKERPKCATNSAANYVNCDDKDYADAILKPDRNDWCVPVKDIEFVSGQTLLNPPVKSLSVASVAVGDKNIPVTKKKPPIICRRATEIHFRRPPNPTSKHCQNYVNASENPPRQQSGLASQSSLEINNSSNGVPSSKPPHYRKASANRCQSMKSVSSGASPLSTPPMASKPSTSSHKFASPFSLADQYFPPKALRSSANPLAVFSKKPSTSAANQSNNTSNSNSNSNDATLHYQSSPVDANYATPVSMSQNVANGNYEIPRRNHLANLSPTLPNASCMRSSSATNCRPGANSSFSLYEDPNCNKLSLRGEDVAASGRQQRPSGFLSTSTSNLLLRNNANQTAALSSANNPQANPLIKSMFAASMDHIDFQNGNRSVPDSVHGFGAKHAVRFTKESSVSSDTYSDYDNDCKDSRSAQQQPAVQYKETDRSVVNYDDPRRQQFLSERLIKLEETSVQRHEKFPSWPENESCASNCVSKRTSLILATSDRCVSSQSIHDSNYSEYTHAVRDQTQGRRTEQSPTSGSRAFQPKRILSNRKDLSCDSGIYHDLSPSGEASRASSYEQLDDDGDQSAQPDTPLRWFGTDQSLLREYCSAYAIPAEDQQSQYATSNPSTKQPEMTVKPSSAADSKANSSNSSNCSSPLNSSRSMPIASILQTKKSRDGFASNAETKGLHDAIGAGSGEYETETLQRSVKKNREVCQKLFSGGGVVASSKGQLTKQQPLKASLPVDQMLAKTFFEPSAVVASSVKPSAVVQQLRSKATSVEQLLAHAIDDIRTNMTAMQAQKQRYTPTSVLTRRQSSFNQLLSTPANSSPMLPLSHRDLSRMNSGTSGCSGLSSSGLYAEITGGEGSSSTSGCGSGSNYGSLAYDDVSGNSSLARSSQKQRLPHSHSSSIVSSISSQSSGPGGIERIAEEETAGVDHQSHVASSAPDKAQSGLASATSSLGSASVSSSLNRPRDRSNILLLEQESGANLLEDEDSCYGFSSHRESITSVMRRSSIDTNLDCVASRKSSGDSVRKRNSFDFSLKPIDLLDEAEKAKEPQPKLVGSFRKYFCQSISAAMVADAKRLAASSGLMQSMPNLLNNEAALRRSESARQKSAANGGERMSSAMTPAAVRLATSHDSLEKLNEHPVHGSSASHQHSELVNQSKAVGNLDPDKMAFFPEDDISFESSTVYAVPQKVRKRDSLQRLQLISSSNNEVSLPVTRTTITTRPLSQIQLLHSSRSFASADPPDYLPPPPPTTESSSALPASSNGPPPYGTASLRSRLIKFGSTSCLQDSFYATSSSSSSGISSVSSKHNHSNTDHHNNNNWSSAANSGNRAMEESASSNSGQTQSRNGDGISSSTANNVSLTNGYNRNGVSGATESSSSWSQQRSGLNGMASANGNNCGKPLPPRPPPKVVHVYPWFQQQQPTTTAVHQISVASSSAAQPSQTSGLKSATSHPAIHSIGKASPPGSSKPPPLPPKPEIIFRNGSMISLKPEKPKKLPRQFVQPSALNNGCHSHASDSSSNNANNHDSFAGKTMPSSNSCDSFNPSSTTTTTVYHNQRKETTFPAAIVSGNRSGEYSQPFAKHDVGSVSLDARNNSPACGAGASNISSGKMIEIAIEREERRIVAPEDLNIPMVVNRRRHEEKRRSVDARCEALSTYLAENSGDNELRDLLTSQRTSAVECLKDFIAERPTKSSNSNADNSSEPMLTAANTVHRVICNGNASPEIAMKYHTNKSRSQAFSSLSPSSTSSLSSNSSFSEYNYTSSSNAALQQRTEDAFLLLAEGADLNDLEKKKAELVVSLSRKLKILGDEMGAVNEEIQMNEKLGETVQTWVEASQSSTQQKDRYRQHVEEMDNIVCLLLKLSGQLATVQNSLKCLASTATTQEKQSLVERQRRLQSQLLDAKTLKESIDRRSEDILEYLQKILSDDQLQDYRYFLQQRIKLRSDLREIEDKIKLGEEQKRALEESFTR